MTFRELPPAEWMRLVTDGIEPFATHGLPDPQHWRLIVAEENGRIIACSSLVEQVHNHWFIHPAAQKRPQLVSGLWQATKTVLDAAEVQLVHATISDEQPEVQDMVERLGYIPAGGKLYLMPVANAVLNERT